jgi:hypothetical protein
MFEAPAKEGCLDKAGCALVILCGFVGSLALLVALLAEAVI